MHPSVFKGIENIFLKAYAGVYQIPLPENQELMKLLVLFILFRCRKDYSRIVW